MVNQNRLLCIQDKFIILFQTKHNLQKFNIVYLINIIHYINIFFYSANLNKSIVYPPLQANQNSPAKYIIKATIFLQIPSTYYSTKHTQLFHLDTDFLSSSPLAYSIINPANLLYHQVHQLATIFTKNFIAYCFPRKANIYFVSPRFKFIRLFLALLVI